MEKIQLEDGLKDIESQMRERAHDAILKLNLPPFEAGDLKPVRSEKEIAKCIELEEEKKKKGEEREARMALEKKDKSKKSDTKKNKSNFKKEFKKMKPKKANFRKRRK